MSEFTVALIKPDAFKRRFVGQIISRIEDIGLKMRWAEMRRLSLAQAEQFYRPHLEREYFERLTVFMSSGPLLGMVLSGNNVIERWRDAMGSTFPIKQKPGSIRYDMRSEGGPIHENLVHGSDSPDEFAREARALGWHPGYWL